MAITFTPIEKVLRAKVQLLKKEPFFGILVMQLRFREEPDEQKCATMGITITDDIQFNPKWVDQLTESELQTVLKHEIFHRIFRHHERSWNWIQMRGKDRRFSHMLANIAQDMVINETLSKNITCNLPDGCLAVKDDQCTVNNITVTDISKKTWERIYLELEKQLPPNFNNSGSFGGGDVILPPSDPNNPQANGDTRRLDEELDEKWKGYLARAAAAAKQKGDLPAGMQAFVEGLLEPKVPWSTKLRKAVTAIMGHDQTWRRPSRRGISQGLYLPSVKKELVEVIVHIDTSGSTWEMCGEFFSECSWILNSMGSINMTLILCDCAIQKVLKLSRDDKWSDDWKVKAGGGGTSHQPVIEWINEQENPCKLFISFTDGYSDIPSAYKKLEKQMTTLIVLPEICKEMVKELEGHCSEVIIMQ
jgi:predicted metal-dependent peptidase